LDSNGVIKWPEQPGISFASFRFTPARPPDQREFRFDLGVGLQASGISKASTDRSRLDATARASRVDDRDGVEGPTETIDTA
jgi:hypothetical protein